VLLATWNVNSIRARDARLRAWLLARRPDVLCLQELKCEEAKFPQDWLREAGYEAAATCQKGYNGVAILSRLPLEDVQVGLQDGEANEAARLLSARIGGIRVFSAYFPNGQALGTDKYQYKLRWMQRLHEALLRRHSPQEPLALCGDFNVAPEPRDVHDPPRWEASVLFHHEVREQLRKLAAFGLVDAFRLRNDLPGQFSWWDYRAGMFQRNQGLRIDHVYVTQPLVARVIEASIDRDERKGEAASDHAPVLVRIAD
jgi:exodeoxyribonuclease-3